MTIRHLKIFISVYEASNITRAAEVLHMTQPSVSRAIQEIENYYGIVLFERINHRLSVTETGKSFYAHAIHILDSFDSLEMGLRNWDKYGKLRIGATITLGNTFLPRAVSEYQKKNPNMQLKITVSNCKELEKSLLNNQLDIALIEGGVLNKQLKSEKLGEDRLVLIMHPENALFRKEKLYLSDLCDTPLLMRESGSVSRHFIDLVFASHAINIDPIWESSSTHAIIEGVKAGVGVSILPEKLVAESIKGGEVVTKIIEDEPFCRNNYIVYHENKFLTRSAINFIELCHFIEKAE